MTFESYQNTLHKLLTHFCTSSIESDNLLSGYLTDLIAEELACGHIILDELPVSLPIEDMNISIPSLSVQEYEKHRDHQYLAPLKKIVKLIERELSPFIDGFYLHGSLSTLDYIKGWSDVDTYMILSKKTVTDKRNLLEARKILEQVHGLMKEIDHLQHHGVILATTIDLKSYPEHFLPLSVFERMKKMYGSLDSIKVGVRKFPLGFDHLSVLNFIIRTNEKGIFEHHAYKNEYLLAHYENEENGMYQLKYYLGQFTLIPCLYLTAIGQSIYKKESFDQVRSIFPEETMYWIDKVSLLRETWGDCYDPYDKSNKIPTFVKNIIPDNYFEEGAKVSQLLLNFINEEENKTA